MSPLLPGIIASGISGHLTPPYTPEGSAYELASYTVPSGGIANVTFSVPTGYRHLEIQMSARMTGAANNCYLIINGDTGNNYTFHQMFGSGDGVGAGGNGFSSPSSSPNFNTPASSVTAGIFGAGIMSIHNYADTTKLKTIRTLTGHDTNGGGYIIQRSSLWNSTAAISTLSFIPDSSVSFAEFSSFTLIGYK